MNKRKAKETAKQFKDYLDELEDTVRTPLVLAIISGIGAYAAAEPKILAQMIVLEDDENRKRGEMAK